MNCRVCSATIDFGVLCDYCYKAEKLKKELKEGNYGLLDNHGAEVKAPGDEGPRFTEMDTPEEFQGIIIAKKKDFAARATVEKCPNWYSLKACLDQIKGHLRTSFGAWLTKGIALSKEDPLLLSIVVETWRQDKVIEKFHRFDFKDLTLVESQISLLDGVLEKLPDMARAVSKKLQRSRNVVVSLKWWGTIGEFKHHEFMNEAMKEADLISQGARKDFIQ